MIIMGLHRKVKMDSVNSSMISAVGYDHTHNYSDLYVRFSSGKIYVYRGVPHDVFDELRDAFSVGEYYNENIKGKYASAKLEVLMANRVMPEVRKASQSCLQDVVDELDEKVDEIQAKIDALDAEIDKLVDQKTVIEQARDLLQLKA
jgi:vacuolar-type H+-ATPase subunit I/STV1